MLLEQYLGDSLIVVVTLAVSNSKKMIGREQVTYILAVAVIYWLASSLFSVISSMLATCLARVNYSFKQQAVYFSGIGLVVISYWLTTSRASIRNLQHQQAVHTVTATHSVLGQMSSFKLNTTAANSSQHTQFSASGSVSIIGQFKNINNDQKLWGLSNFEGQLLKFVSFSVKICKCKIFVRGWCQAAS